VGINTKKDTSFSKQFVLGAWKAKNAGLKYPNKQAGHIGKKESVCFHEQYSPNVHA